MGQIQSCFFGASRPYLLAKQSRCPPPLNAPHHVDPEGIQGRGRQLSERGGGGSEAGCSKPCRKIVSRRRTACCPFLCSELSCKQVTYWGAWMPMGWLIPYARLHLGGRDIDKRKLDVMSGLLSNGPSGEFFRANFRSSPFPGQMLRNNSVCQ